MGSSPVKPEFGPTLPELLGRRFGVSVRAAAIAVGGVFVLTVSLGVAKHEQGDGSVRAIVTRGVPFNLRYDPAKLIRATPRAGETLRLQTKAGVRDPASIVVRPVRLPPYAGDDPNVALPIFIGRLLDDMRRVDPTVVFRAERPARVNSQPGYQLQYNQTVGGRTYYGRRALLFPDPRDQPGVRDGVEITLLVARSKVVTNVDDVGSNGLTKLPYRSFRLGAAPPS